MYEFAEEFWLNRQKKNQNEFLSGIMAGMTEGIKARIIRGTSERVPRSNSREIYG